MPQQFGCGSLDKNQSIFQEIQCRQAIFQKSKPQCELEKEVKVTQI